MAGNQDYVSLDWIQGEINNALKQAQLSLEQYAKNHDDSTHIRSCLTLLHQIHGTLKMVEFPGAILFAAEMEALASALLSKQVTVEDDKIALLLKAIRQFPAYLERVKARRRDLPVVILPVLNKIRIAHEVEPLSEMMLFKQQLDFSDKKITALKTKETNSEIIDVEKLPGILKKIRQLFQMALLGILKNQDFEKNIATIGKIFLRLEKLTPESPSKWIWWVADAMMDALVSADMANSSIIKKIFTQLDKAIKSISDRNALVVDRSLSEELLAAMLFVIGKSGLDTPKINAVSAHFKLQQCVLTDTGIERERIMLAGHDSGSVKGVARQAIKQFEQIELNLKAFVETGSDDVEALSSLVVLFKKIADQLRGAKLNEQSLSVLAQASKLKGIVTKGVAPEAAELLEIATSLLGLEASFIELAASSDLEDDLMGDEICTDQTLITIKNPKSAVLKEVIVELEIVKESLLDLMISGWDQDEEVITRILKKIISDLHMLGMGRVCDVLQTTGDFIHQCTINNDEVFDSEKTDGIALVIESVETYLNRLLENSVDELDLLNFAEKTLMDMGVKVSHFLRQEKAIIKIPAHSQDAANIEDKEDKEDKNSESEPIPIEKTISSTQLEESHIVTVNEIKPDCDTAAHYNESIDVKADADADDEVIDDELVEIFVEEADEVLATVNQFLPIWMVDKENKEALHELRRAFHTLKGSGRMVGADQIGALSWSIENLFNRIIEAGLLPSNDIGALITAITEQMPMLVEKFSCRERPILDPSPVERYANELANGQQSSRSLTEVLSASGLFNDIESYDIESHAEGGVEITNIEEIELQEVDDHQDDDTSVANEITAFRHRDSELFEIFSNEADSHLTEVRRFLSEVKQNDSVPLPASFLMALHTLKGSANMAEFTLAARLVSPVYEMMRAFQGRQNGLSELAMDYLTRFVSLFESVMQGLEKGEFKRTKDLERFVEDATTFVESLAENSKHQPFIDSRAGSDPERIAKFLDVSIQYLIDAEESLYEWQVDFANIDKQSDYQDQFKQLAHAALEASLPEIEHLCQIMVRGCLDIAEQNTAFQSQFIDSASEVHKYLLGVVDDLACENAFESSAEVLAKLETLFKSANLSSIQQFHYVPREHTPAEHVLIENSSVNTDCSDEIANEVDAEVDIQVTSEPLAELSVLDTHNPDCREFKIDTESSEYSPELLEIFMEEAAELIEQTVGLMEQWLQEPDNTQPVSELQRLLHTLKGGARMSEIMPLGDLAHYLETVYEGICERKYCFSTALKELLLACHDRLAEMLDQLGACDACYFADDMIAELERFQENPMSFETVVVKELTPLEAKKDLDTISTEDEAAEIASPLMPASKNPLQDEAPEPSIFELIEVNEDGVDREILEICLDEVKELSFNIDAAIDAWKLDWLNISHSQEIQRHLHSLKGSARTAGLMKLGDLSHEFEQFIIETDKKNGFDKPEFSEKLLNYFDDQMKMIELISAKLNSTSDDELNNRLSRKRPSGKVLGIVESSSALNSTVSENTHTNLVSNVTNKNAVTNFEDREFQNVTKRGSQETIKVTSQILEDLVNLAGETSISRGRVEQDVNNFGFIIDDMSATIKRLRDLLRRLDLETEAQILSNYEQEGMEYNADFDPLELDQYSALNHLSRSLSESASDLMDFRSTLAEKVRDTESLLTQQARVITQLHEGLMKTRMVPFSRMAPRLKRLVRQVSNEIGKNAELEVVNAEGELDRTILERMVSPLEHMLRNALDHGIETPEVREQANKPKVGRITLHFVREGSEVVIRISDDGAGINLEKVKRKAIEKGMMVENANLTDNEILQFVFKAGFSTATTVTQISGRGVGMDVVFSGIKQMGGSMKIHSAVGAGTQFTIRLPFTVSVNRALMVRVGDDNYAISLNQIEGVVRVTTSELQNCYDNNALYHYAGRDYQVQYLGFHVHGTSQPNLETVQKPLPVLLVRGGEQAIALQVDTLIGSREIVAKSVGPQLSTVGGISGATILGDGNVVIILDMLALMRAARAESMDEKRNLEAVTNVGKKDRSVPLVLVVDDSVTVRKVTSRLLERHGMDVITAKDGVDAMSVLHDSEPDIILLDIEMPRMDGFEVATQIRHSERLKNIPIVMITSRGGEKHKNRADEIGVNDYMGKPFQEGELLQKIAELISPELADLL